MFSTLQWDIELPQSKIVMMARAGILLLGALLLLLLCAVREVDAALPSQKASSARKEDVKFIKCEVCEEIVKQLTREVKKRRDKVAPRKLTELEIIEITENICNMKKQEADWMMYLDIVEDGDKLKLVAQEQEGECNAECKTIERACQVVMGDHDTDLAEFMFKGEVKRAALSKLLCKDLSKACVGRPPKVPKNRKPGEPFSPKSSKDAEMERLMRSMGDMPGAPGMQMFSKDQLLQRGFGNEDDDDDEDFDDDDRPFPPKGHTSKDVKGTSGLVEQAQMVLGKLKSGAQEVVKAAGKLTKRWFGSAKKKSSRTSKPKSSKSSKAEL